MIRLVMKQFDACWLRVRFFNTQVSHNTLFLRRNDAPCAISIFVSACGEIVWLGDNFLIGWVLFGRSSSPRVCGLLATVTCGPGFALRSARGARRRCIGDFLGGNWKYVPIVTH